MQKYTQKPYSLIATIYYRKFVTLVAAVCFVFGGFKALLTLVSTINSDNLYLAGLFRDQFVDRIGIRSWILQSAPSFFPDLPIYFTFRAISQSPPIVEILYVAAFNTLLLVGVTKLMRPIAKDTWDAFLASITGVSLILFALSHQLTISNFLHPSHHGAALLVGLLSFGYFLTGTLRFRSLTIFILTNALTFASDSLYFLVSFVPLLSAVVFLGILRLVSFKRTAIEVSALILALACGVGLNEYWTSLSPSWTMNTPKTGELINNVAWHKDDLIRLIQTLPYPFQDNWVYCLILILFVSVTVLAILWLGFALFNRARIPAADAKTVCTTGHAVYFLVATVGGTAGILLAGMYSDAYKLRYFQAAFVLPILGLGLLPIYFWSRKNTWIAHTVILILNIGMIVALRSSAAANSKTWKEALRPTFVQCIASMARHEHIQLGYGHYWHGRYLTEMTHGQVRVLPLKPEATHDNWIVNPYWQTHLPSNDKGFFVVIDQLVPSEVENKFGKPDAVITCDGKGVNIYRRNPRDVVL